MIASIFFALLTNFSLWSMESVVISPDLPIETQKKIIKDLDLRSFKNLIGVNKAFYQLASHEDMWEKFAQDVIGHPYESYGLNEMSYKEGVKGYLLSHQLLDIDQWSLANILSMIGNDAQVNYLETLLLKQLEDRVVSYGQSKIHSANDLLAILLVYYVVYIDLADHLATSAAMKLAKTNAKDKCQQALLNNSAGNAVWQFVKKKANHNEVNSAGKKAEQAAKNAAEQSALKHAREVTFKATNNFTGYSNFHKTAFNTAWHLAWGAAAINDAHKRAVKRHIYKVIEDKLSFVLNSLNIQDLDKLGQTSYKLSSLLVLALMSKENFLYYTEFAFNSAQRELKNIPNFRLQGNDIIDTWAQSTWEHEQYKSNPHMLALMRTILRLIDKVKESQDHLPRALFRS